MTPARIVVLGSVNMDLVLRVPRLPAAGETLLGRDLRTLPGGKGANQAVAAARLGAPLASPVSFIGCVGDDAFGQAARAALANEGIDTEHLHTLAGTATGVALIFVDDAGHNCIGLSAGANAGLTTDHVDAAAALIASASVLVCQLESPLPVVRHAIELAHGAGVAVLLNPAPAQALPADLAPMVTWLVPNESEAATLAGPAAGEAAALAGPAAGEAATLAGPAAGEAAALAGPAAGEAATLAGSAAGDDIHRVTQRLAELGYANVVVTLGERGVCLASHGTTTAFPARVVRAIDTTGAGDTFAGALAVAASERLGLPAAIGFAQRAAAISVTREGAMASMPRRDELDTN